MESVSHLPETMYDDESDDDDYSDDDDDDNDNEVYDVNECDLLFKHEENIEKACKSSSLYQNYNNNFLELYKRLLDNILTTYYEDISKMVSERSVFFICGDSLILCMMKNSTYSIKNGGQLLQLIYLCERVCDVFSKKGGVMEIVFFDIWKHAWIQNPALSLARRVLYMHMKSNTSIEVSEFFAVWDPAFQTYMNSQKPNFLLMNLELPYVYENLFGNFNSTMIDIAFHAQVVCCVAFGLPCVDLLYMRYKIFTLETFIIEGLSTLKNLICATLQSLNMSVTKQIDNIRINNNNNQFDVGTFESGQDIRYVATVISAACYLKENNNNENWVRVFLIYSALLEILPLKNRGCPCPSTEATSELELFISTIQYNMNSVIEKVTECNYNTNKVCDLWHGNLFVNTIHILKNLEVCNEEKKLGNQTLEIYKKLVREVGAFANVTFNAFPIDLSKIQCHHTCDTPCNLSVSAKNYSVLIPLSSDLVHSFLGQSLTETLNQNALDFESLSCEETFPELEYWQMHDSLTDQNFHTASATEKSTNKTCDKIRLKLKAKFSKYMYVYGSTLSDDHAPKVITVKKGGPIAKTTSKSHSPSRPSRKNKPSLKYAIIQRNILSKPESKRKEDKSLFESCSETYKKLNMSRKHDEAFQILKILIEKLSTEEYIQKALLLRIDFHFQLWLKEFRMKVEKHERDLSVIRNILLDLRQILKLPISLSNSDAKHVSQVLYSLGFKELAVNCSLPLPNDENITCNVGMSWIQFQLLHMGPDFDRVIEGEPDPRVSFIPDPWQKRMFDVIDKRQSAVIVAPTSSGKTHAAFYCMESVLREDNEGVVIYVSPTKALVNQIAATIYSRFRKKQMPPGKALYGIMTRDYCYNYMICQILVTVPQCLEILLLSPSFLSWLHKLKYVIFDEFHCVSEEISGLAWETGLLLSPCPFLALSATIESTNEIHNWLQNAETFKEEIYKLYANKRNYSHHVEIIIHNKRHNDLKTYVYNENSGLKHRHPYVHVNHRVLGEHQGLPKHLSLSAEETWQLYNAMDSVKCNVHELQPEQYFCTSSFLTKSDVEKYEEKLSKVFEELSTIDEAKFTLVLEALDFPSGRSSFVKESNSCVTLNGFLKLIEHLKINNLFPAIVFRYDRRFVDAAFEHYVTYWNTLSTYVVENKQIKHEIRDKKQNTSMSTHSVKCMVKEDSRRCIGLAHVLPNNSGSLKNVGSVDSSDVEFIESKLLHMGYKATDTFPTGLRLGLGKHHSGMPHVEKFAVEVLFRMKLLNLVIATGTLSLGIHMPCKTVVIAGDSPYINALTYHQMSGRAGRRGFDNMGNVIFYGLTKRKQGILQVGKLPKIAGNFPFTISHVLRFLILLETFPMNVEGTKVSRQDALARILTYLNCNLIYQFFPQLKNQMKYFFYFAIEFLFLQGLVDSKGLPYNYSHMVTQLHYHIPGIFVFFYLFRSGALRKLCQIEENGMISRSTELNLVLLLSYLFNPIPLKKSQGNKIYNNSKVKLAPLPQELKNELKKYNDQASSVFLHYIKCLLNHTKKEMGEEHKLPFSNIEVAPSTLDIEDFSASNLETRMVEQNSEREICSRFVALSGHDDSLSNANSALIFDFRNEVFIHHGNIPYFNYRTELNGYLWDFYNHGVLVAIMKENNINPGTCFQLLDDFNRVLKSICVSLEKLLSKDDPVLKVFNFVKNNYEGNFSKAFYKTKKSL